MDALPVTIRPITPEDARALEALYAGMSPDDLHARFLGMTRGLSSGQSKSFCGADHAGREGFVALVPGPSGTGQRVVGHLCLEPDGPGIAEVGIAVAADVRRAGIGRRLLQAGLEWAAATGVHTFTASMLGTNLPVIRLLGSLGLPHCVRWGDDGIATMTIELTHPALRAA